MSKEYKATIGLEVHCELKTQTKIFCSCKNEFGGEPNTHCCPICSGFPGVLPVLNKRAVEYTVKAGLALNCNISKFSKWDRKNYFYPDLPKAWQTSQYDLPLCMGGRVDFTVDGKPHSVRLNRIHLEEDAGKLIHEGNVTRVDFNRCGVPLMEIVTEPDMHSAKEVIAFLTELKSILKYTGVSDVKMQEGSMRCDVNLSLSDTEELGTRTETKNLNSFRSVARAIEFEIERQTEVLSGGGKVIQETRRFDDNKGEGSAMRSKEDAQDYRYFPEPDLVPVIMSDDDIARIKSEIPMLKGERMQKYQAEYGLPAYDCEVLTQDIEVAQLFDKVVAMAVEPKKASNFIMSEVLKLAKSANEDELNIKITPESLAELLKMVSNGELSNLAAKTVLSAVWGSDEMPLAAAERLNLKQNNDAGALKAVFDSVIAANPSQVADFKAGNDKLRGYFVGMVMKASGGKANPKIINEFLDKIRKDG